MNSDGTMTAAGSLISDPNPVALSMDAAGKFLFVAEGINSLSTAPNAAPCPGTTAQYGICVYAIGGGGALTGVPGNFTFPTTLLAADFVAVAATPTVFPGIGINGVQNAVCSTPGNSPPTSEFLYAVDAVNNVVWEFSVDTSTGALGNPPGMSAAGSVPTAAFRLVLRSIHATDSCMLMVSRLTRSAPTDLCRYRLTRCLSECRWQSGCGERFAVLAFRKRERPRAAGGGSVWEQRVRGRNLFEYGFWIQNQSHIRGPDCSESADGGNWAAPNIDCDSWR